MEKKVMEAHVKVDIEVLESLLKPENLEVSPRFLLKYSTRRGSNIFQLFDTSEKPNHFVARRRWLESGPNEWHDIEYRGAMAKAPCSETTQKNSVAAAKLVVSQRRRRPLGLDGRQAKRGIAFENLAKEMLRYLDNSEEVKVGMWASLNCKNDWRYRKIGISVRQVA